jgi:Protein of unknown function (DUF1275)
VPRSNHTAICEDFGLGLISIGAGCTDVTAFLKLGELSTSVITGNTALLAVALGGGRGVRLMFDSGPHTRHALGAQRLSRPGKPHGRDLVSIYSRRSGGQWCLSARHSVRSISQAAAGTVDSATPGALSSAAYRTLDG